MSIYFSVSTPQSSESQILYNKSLETKNFFAANWLTLNPCEGKSFVQKATAILTYVLQPSRCIENHCLTEEAYPTSSSCRTWGYPVAPPFLFCRPLIQIRCKGNRSSYMSNKSMWKMILHHVHMQQPWGGSGPIWPSRLVILPMTNFHNCS